MPATEWKVISWSPDEPINDEKLDAMVSNMEWLRAQTVQGRYSAYSVTRTENVRIACGLALITSRKSAIAPVQISFGGFFSDGCRPVMTTGVVSNYHRTVFHSVSGVGELSPTNNSAELMAVVISSGTGRQTSIKKNFYLSWNAIGY